MIAELGFEYLVMNITEESITKLAENDVFVFGSNEGGRHGKGAAKTALKWGAKYGQAEGLQGRTYGIPTVNASISKSLSVDKIKTYVDRFLLFTKERQDLHFLVTEIGCGLAGLTPKQIAPLFKDALEMKNVSLPRKFIRVISKT